MASKKAEKPNTKEKDPAAKKADANSKVKKGNSKVKTLKKGKAPCSQKPCLGQRNQQIFQISYVFPKGHV